jgi:hypothetical protein
MSNVVEFLQRMGQDAQLRHASQNELELVLAGVKIAPELQAAILAGDQAMLEVLLGRVNVCCMVQPGKEDDDEDTEEDPSRGGEAIVTHLVSGAMASVA